MVESSKIASEVKPPAPPAAPTSLGMTPRPNAGRPRRGYLPQRLVRGFAFWTITLCILASVVASIIAIWQEKYNSGLLWKTIATSLVIAAACGVFASVNTSLGAPADEA